MPQALTKRKRKTANASEPTYTHLILHKQSTGNMWAALCGDTWPKGSMANERQEGTPQRYPLCVECDSMLFYSCDCDEARYTAFKGKLGLA